MTSAIDGTATVGNQPYGLTFDGTDLWATNSSDNTVSEVNPETAAVIGSPIAVGSQPEGIAFDGTSLWVAKLHGNSVPKINPTTQSVVLL